jgi:hypothetical protein
MNVEPQHPIVTGEKHMLGVKWTAENRMMTLTLTNSAL